MGFHCQFAKSQAQPCPNRSASLPRLNLDEPVKDAVKVFFWDAGSLIGDGEVNPTVIHENSHLDGATTRRVFEGVAEQVDKDADENPAVSNHLFRHIRFKLDLQIDIALPGSKLDLPNRFPNRLSRLKLLQVKREFAFLKFPKVKDGVDHRQ